MQRRLGARAKRRLPVPKCQRVTNSHGLCCDRAASCHLRYPGLISYSSAMGDAATFIAPALLVAYLAVGGLLLLVSDVRKRRGSRRQAL